jgi:hypothetical protein
MATPKDRDEDVTGSRDYRKEDNILIYWHNFDDSYVTLNYYTKDTSKTGTRPILLQPGDTDQQSSHA